jgi:hypothetical protein
LCAPDPCERPPRVRRWACDRHMWVPDRTERRCRFLSPWWAWYRQGPIVSEVATKSTRPPAYEIRDKGPETPCVVLAWSAEQPELAGAVAPLVGPRLLGRGPSAPDDPAPRLELARLRPSGPAWVPPLAGATLSRRQVLLVPSSGGTVTASSLGRCPMLLHGKAVESGVLSPGDTLVLQEVLVLLVVARPRYWLPAPAHAVHDFPFGAADASGLVGESPVLWELRDAIAFAAQSGQHVLVHGESGTGKELAARAVHMLSPRHRGPFVARNAATLPEGLVDAELFGNARGYPHANSPERPGLIGEAGGGTLFLDEIGELRHDLQAHLPAPPGPPAPAASEPSEPGEREKIEAALARTNGRIAPAARLLGLKNRYVLYRLMEKHGMRAAGGEDDDAGE